jgi:hypothetical protein
MLKNLTDLYDKNMQECFIDNFHYMKELIYTYVLKWAILQGLQEYTIQKVCLPIIYETFR